MKVGREIGRAAEGRTHECPAAGCADVVGFDVLACKRHWFALPLPLRQRISRTWRSGDLLDWYDARADAVRLLEAVR